MERKVRVGTVRDSGDYTHKVDPRVVPFIKEVDVPLVVLFAALMAAHMLQVMYSRDDILDSHPYGRSLEQAERAVSDWCAA